MLLEGPMGSGSGVVIADGWILTAAHVLPVFTADGNPVGEAIEHPFLDLALIPCEAAVGTGLRMADVLPELHDPLRSYGWWLAVQYQMVEGFQGAAPGESSAPVIHGCSGGAVTNERGELVGIIATVSYARTQMGDGYAITHMAGYTPIDEDVRGWITLHILPEPEAK